MDNPQWHTFVLRLKRYKRAIEEYKQSWGVFFYRPLPYQIEFHEAKQPNRALVGANRTGKTTAGAVEAVWAVWPDYSILGYGLKLEHPCTVAVVSPSYKQQRDAAQRKFFELLPLAGKDKIWNVHWAARRKGMIDFIEFANGSRIVFYSEESGQETPQGAGIDLWWLDEEVNESYYQEARVRLTAGRAIQFLFTLTTLQGETWIVKRIVRHGLPDKDGKRPRKYFAIQASMEENMQSVGGYLSDREVKSILDEWGGAEDDWVMAVRLKGKLLPISGRSVYSRPSLMAMGKDVKEPTFTEGNWKFWAQPDKKHTYYLGCDPATGKSSRRDKQGRDLGDWQAIEIFDLDTKHQVAEYQSHAEQHEVAREIAEACKKWNYPEVIVETNAATMMLDEVARHCPSARFYQRWKPADDVNENVLDKRGWYTDRRSKADLILNTKRCLSARDFIVHSEKLYEEFCNFILTEHGYYRAEAAPGYHDDLLFACMMAWEGGKNYVAPEPEPEEKPIDWTKTVWAAPVKVQSTEWEDVNTNWEDIYV